MSEYTTREILDMIEAKEVSRAPRLRGGQPDQEVVVSMKGHMPSG